MNNIISKLEAIVQTFIAELYYDEEVETPEESLLGSATSSTDFSLTPQRTVDKQKQCAANMKEYNVHNIY